MAHLLPFQGVHYNPAVAGDTARVICPPYDVISPGLQQELYEKSDYNFIRIEYGRDLPQDKENDNRYTRAGLTFNNWLQHKVLVMDTKPGLYVNDHYFTIFGQTFCRRAFNCLIKLEEWESKVVRPHEGTLSKPKGDRLNMLYALQANTSPIMGLYEDKSGSVKAALESQTTGTPLLSANLGNGESHHLWAITDTNAIYRVCGALADQPVYIADGHHRYESALIYQRERRMRLNSEKGDEAFDYVMITLIDFKDPGLVILPAHRMVRGLSQDAVESLKNGLSAFFNVRIVNVDTDDSTNQINQLLESGTETTLVVYGLVPGELHVLTVKDMGLIKTMMPYFHTELYQKLDVSILDHVILEELLGLTSDMVGGHVAYTVDIQEALKVVDEKEYQLSIFVNPVKPSTIKSIADSGDRMPRKSTYFYPKIPAGLVLHKFA